LIQRVFNMTEQKKAKHKLTVKQRKFIKLLPKCKTAKEAAILAGYSEKTAKDQASQLLSNPKLSSYIAQILDRAGLTDQAIADKILALINAKKTMFFSHQGKVVDKREVEALDIQADMTKFVTKIKGHVIDRSQVETPGIEEILRQIADKRQQQLKHD